jgi:predicted nuclease of restriction endonuclease-like RecB superfamily
MLTADHVDARRQGDALVLKKLDARGLDEARELAEAYLDAARANVGRRREELGEACKEIATAAKRRRLAAGIEKLVLDACVFDDESEIDPVALRSALFQRASEVRRARVDLAPFDRDAIVRDVAASMSRAPEELERALFADLRGEHVQRSAPTQDAASIVEAYELGRAQAILLRAVRMRCEVDAGSPAAVRAFFAWLKFQKLLFAVERSDGGGFAVTIDGPFSMFESVTRYGLRFALVLPALRALSRWSLVAEVRWGKERTPLTFRMSSSDALAWAAPRERAADDAAPSVADDVRALMEGLEALRTGRAGASRWRCAIATTLLDRPGLGVCIPDLVLHDEADPKRAPVYVEVLGFWSRDAVWRRVELAQRGLDARVVFCASSRLRVSAEVLDDDAPAALYVYKGKPNARALLDRVERVAAAPLV